jgi:hypothetical protein
MTASFGAGGGVLGGGRLGEPSPGMYGVSMGAA